MIAKETILSLLEIPEETRNLLTNSKGLTFATTAEELAELSCPPQGWKEVVYDIPGKGAVTEARVCKAKNGVAINVAMDLQPFEWINPCGFPGLRTLDMASLGVHADVDQVASAFAEEFSLLWQTQGGGPTIPL